MVFARRAAAILAAFIVVGVVPAVAQATVPPPLGPPGTWHLKWQDDFRKDSTLNLNKWAPRWWGSGCKTSITSSAPGGGNALKFALLSGSSGCEQRTYYAPTYGAFQTRMWGAVTPSGLPADHNTFWTRADGVWEEIDAYENSHVFIHAIDGSSKAAVRPAGQWAGQWHTYTADWEPGGVTVYWDGTKVAYASESSLGWPGAPQQTVLNLFDHVGDNIYFPAYSYFRYVRIWQH